MEITSFSPALTTKPEKKAIITDKATNAQENKENSGKTKIYSQATINYFKAGNAVSFGGGLSNFKIKKLENVPCPCCGRIMLTPESTTKHVNRLNLAKGNKLADRIEKEEESFLRSNERACALMAAKKARNSDLNLSQAMQKVTENLPQNFNDICTDILMNTIIICDEELGENSEISRFLIEETENFNKNNDYYRPNLTEAIAQYKNSISEESYIKIENELLKLPVDFASVEKIMTSIENNSPTVIAQKLFAPSLATAEHVHPHSLGGKNSSSNFLSECAGCNNPRSSMPYLDWLKIHPEFSRNPQVYIEHVENRIVNGELSDAYYTYPTDIKETLTKESEGYINLKVLDKAKLIELRENKKNGKDVDIHEETNKSEEEQNKE